MNTIWKHLQEHDRSLLWLANKYGLNYQRLYRMQECTDIELASKLTFEEVQTLSKEIPNIKDQLKHG